MNLNSLFAPQKKLDDRIVKEKGLEGQDLFKKKVVALLCELYECANEMRMFKFWSNDQKSRGRALTCDNCGTRMQKGNTRYVEGGGHCNETGDMFYQNPLLEEYVDVIHFTLSIANDLGYTSHAYLQTQPRDLNDLVIGITNAITVLAVNPNKNLMQSIFNNLIELGFKLGFDDEQVIAAYHDKNAINHHRQDNNY